MDYKELYEQNEAFRALVDRTCKGYGLTVDEALQKHTVRDVAEYYNDPLYQTGIQSETINVGCGGTNNGV